MAKIRITSTPPGEAPQQVRSQWVGVEIPLPDEEPRCGLQLGVNLGKPQNLSGYAVEVGVAIEALRARSPEAADWWDSKFPHRDGGYLVFSRRVCEMVS